jgi:hypothetical protein
MGMNNRQLAERVCIGLTPLAWGPSAFFLGDDEGPGLLQLEHFNPKQVPRPVTGQTAVHSLRNLICREFLDKRSEPYLLFLDHDMMYPADLLVHVGSYRAPIVSGTYFIRDLDRPLPVAFAWREDGARLRYLIKETYEWLQESERGLHQVDVVGAGCLAIRRDVLEAMKGDWFQGSIGAEDVYFCRRAKELGFPIELDTRLVCRHLQQMGIGANWFLAWANAQMRQLEVSKQGG